jgi:hypothetical protein
MVLYDVSDGDLHYLRSILRNVRELYSLVATDVSLRSEALADNIDWLDCFINRLEKDRNNVRNRPGADTD